MIKKCKYGCHVWDLTTKPIKCKKCQEMIEQPNKDVGDNPLQYTSDEYSF